MVFTQFHLERERQFSFRDTLNIKQNARQLKSS